jgi:peptidoglycan hydrolase-like protein with peptidoglycan-binding domain
MAIPFMKNEAEGTQDVAFWAGLAITIGLAAVSLYGVWAEPGMPEPQPDTWGIIVGKVLYSIAVVGAEFLTAVALYRTIIAETWPRRIVGFVVFIGLAWYCVHNVERGIHRIYPTVFSSDAQELRDLATLAGTQATSIDAAATTAISSIPEQLAQARTDLAKLEAELTKITASSTETSIKIAQQHLQGLGYYDGNIDGKWEELTKDAVLRRGDEIRAEMGIKKNVITGLERGTPVASTATASEDQNKVKITNEAKARKREAFGRQITAGAWVLESARSLTFVVYIAGIAGALIMRRKRDIELAKLDNELEDIKSRKAAPPAPAVPEPPPAPISEPVASPVAAEAPAQPEPETILQPPLETPEQPVTQAEPEPIAQTAPDPEPQPELEPMPDLEPVAAADLNSAQRRSKKGGEANQFYKRAGKLKIPLPDQFPEDIEQEQAA